MANFILNGKVYGSDSGGGGGGSSDLEAVEKTKAQYDELTPEQKADTNKIYFITDYNPPSGGSSTVTITPTYNTGTKIADYEVDGIKGHLYIPNSGGGSSWNYSTTKVDTGQKWIDDRTIYCKVYTWQTQITNIGNNSWKNLDIPSNDENWEIFINVIGGNQVGVVWNFLSLNYDGASYLQIWNPRSAAIQLKWLAVWFVENNVGE